MSTRLRHFTCGRTSHDLARLFDGGASEVRSFPAGVFLYERGDVRVLFDTGYPTGQWRTGWRGAAYRRLLPPVVSHHDDVSVVLRTAGVDPASVTHVVLSHLHPDHIGGLRRFPEACIVMTDGQLRTLRAAPLRSGLLPGLVPEWFDDAERIVLAEDDFRPLRVRGTTLRAAQPLGAGFTIIDLPGHADGHIGALIEERVLLAGDAAWGADLLGCADRMRRIPSLVQHDIDAYRRTAALLRDAAEAGLEIVCSHDPVHRQELL